MSQVQWIKVNTDITNNRKIKALRCEKNGDKKFLVWFLLLLTAGQINDNGRIYFTEKIPYDSTKLAKEYMMPKVIIEEALQFFKDNEMIEIDEQGIIQLLNWNEYQNAEKLNKIREQVRERQQRYYDAHRKPNAIPNATPNATPNANLTQTNKEERTKEVKDIDLDIEKNREELEKNTTPIVLDILKKCPRNYGFFIRSLIEDQLIGPSIPEETLTMLDSYFSQKPNKFVRFKMKLQAMTDKQLITNEYINELIKEEKSKP